jgi:predicted RNA-binding protein YlxR (DUF448 family)
LALKLHRRCVSCQCTELRDRFWRVVRVPIAPIIEDDQGNHQNTGNTGKKHENKKSEKSEKSFQIQLDHGMGRSAYLCQKLECLQIAQKKNRLGRSLRTPIPPEIFDLLKSRL